MEAVGLDNVVTLTESNAPPELYRLQPPSIRDDLRNARRKGRTMDAGIARLGGRGGAGAG